MESLTPIEQQRQPEVSRLTRRGIIDYLKIQQVEWSGVLNDVDFLERIFDLRTLPSHDRRFSNAKRDIWQHRVNNVYDWNDDWVYSDPRFDLTGCSSRLFLTFLCEMVHPVVRADSEETAEMVSQFNERLRMDGWELYEVERIAERPRFAARERGPGRGRAIARARESARALSAEWMSGEVERMEGAVDGDPALAIGTAKDLVESCCKCVLSDRGIEIGRKATLPQLAKRMAGELSLVPESVPESAKGADNVRRVLQNLASLVHNLAELRGLYGSGHGRDGQYRGLQPRHARLAVGAAVTFIDFVVETHAQRNASSVDS